MPKRRQIKYRRDPDVVSMQTKGLHPRTYARMALTQALHSLDVAIGLSYEVLHEPKPEVLELEKAVKAVEGAVHGTGTKARWNRVPRAARASRCGLIPSGPP